MRDSAMPNGDVYLSYSYCGWRNQNEKNLELVYIKTLLTEKHSTEEWYYIQKINAN